MIPKAYRKDSPHIYAIAPDMMPIQVSVVSCERVFNKWGARATEKPMMYVRNLVEILFFEVNTIHSEKMLEYREAMTHQIT